MPFVKRTSSAGAEASPPTTAADAFAGLRHADAEERWKAARALGGETGAAAVQHLAAALETEQVPRVREALMTALMRTGDATSVAVLLPYLRSQDAGLRSAATEALQGFPDRIGTYLPALLEDPDSDVRLLATELARAMPADAATDVLSKVILHETHPNVCAAAIEVLTEVGTAAALPALRACADRFAATPFLPFAVSVAMARISKSEG